MLLQWTGAAASQSSSVHAATCRVLHIVPQKGRGVFGEGWVTAQITPCDRVVRNAAFSLGMVSVALLGIPTPLSLGETVSAWGAEMSSGTWFVVGTG